MPERGDFSLRGLIFWQSYRGHPSLSHRAKRTARALVYHSRFAADRYKRRRLFCPSGFPLAIENSFLLIKKAPPRTRRLKPGRGYKKIYDSMRITPTVPHTMTCTLSARQIVITTQHRGVIPTEIKSDPSRIRTCRRHPHNEGETPACFRKHLRPERAASCT